MEFQADSFTPNVRVFSVFEDYTQWESAQPTRNELHSGYVVALPDETRLQATVKLNVLATLHSHTKGSPNRAYGTSLKLRPHANHLDSFYPDAFVTCDPQDRQTDMVFTSPSVIVEVMSCDTEAYDRGLKFAAYRQIAALKEYLLIDPETRVVELYRRGADTLFTLHDCTGRSAVELSSIGCTLTAHDIFEGLDPLPA